MSKYSNRNICAILIGKNGQDLKNLEKETRSNIKIVQIDPSFPYITVSAKKDDLTQAVVKVQEKIQDIIKNIDASKSKSGLISKIVEIPQTQSSNNYICAILIGKNGQDLIKLEKETQSNIKIVQTDPNFPYFTVSAKNRDIVSHAVVKVQEKIQKIIGDLDSPLVSKRIDIPQTEYSNNYICAMLVGKHEQDRIQLEKETESKIQIEQTDPNLPYIKVFANNEDTMTKAVVKVQDKIQEVIKNIDSLTQKIEIPQSKHPNINFWRLFVGKNGKDITELEKETHSRIKIVNNLPAPHVLVTAKDTDMLKKTVGQIQLKIKCIIEMAEISKRHPPQSATPINIRSDNNAPVYVCQRVDIPLRLLMDVNNDFISHLERKMKSKITLSNIDPDKPYINVAAKDAFLVKSTVAMIESEIEQFSMI